MKKWIGSIVLIGLLTLTTRAFTGEGSSLVTEIPAKNMVTMVDIGAKKCMSCKMMAPILEELAKEYEGKAAIFFIDIWENKEQGVKFDIRSIPTQIFYDKHGNEIYRHEGFLDKESIVAILKKAGAAVTETAESSKSKQD